ncbi:ABC transporter permease/substrate binding protein [Embleya hyalina]|uniref:Glycine/betaine ABC transporter permease n=1 Tax=Embleya hyalina TaxID=516124 RepID=A0A401Z0P7_9ACTN|nr:ABC transporter permease/substrate binding protein [Embleya hyalina]GCE00425.1 glycine/betaine ABC transporter permease [Embleya hyalina]
MPRIHLGDWAESLVDFMRDHFSWLFDFIRSVVGGAVTHLADWLTDSPLPVVVVLFAVIGWAVRGPVFALVAAAGFLLIDGLDMWKPAMSTLALVLVSAAIALLVAIPLGILTARSRAVGAVLRPVLDFMQTMPAFVYLIPAITFFGIGEVPGVVATVVFALPPGVRMTELGIRSVDAEMVEAAEAFGTSEWRILKDVQFPLALPTIMAGVNQVIMLSLSMVVTAGIVGAGGLGSEVFGALSNNNVGLGVEAGVAVVVLAIYLDRTVGAAGQRAEARAKRAKAVRGADGFTPKWLLDWRPRPVVAVGGVVTVALVAGLLGGFGLGASDGGRKKITVGWIPWEEDVVVTNMYKQLLEKRGYDVTMKQLDVGPLFQGLARGDIDLFLDAWLPTLHKKYLDEYGSKLEEIGRWYNNVDVQLAIPKNLPYESVEDLKGHEKEFGGRIVGIEPGANIMDLTEKKLIPEYGLDFDLVKSSTPAMIAELDRQMAAGKPIVVTMWRPHWAYTKYDIKPLADPKQSYGAPGWISSIGRKGFAEDFPDVNTWVKNLKLDDSVLGPLEKKVFVDYAGKPNAAAEGVKAYLKENPDVEKKFLSELPPAGDASGTGGTERPKQDGGKGGQSAQPQSLPAGTRERAEVS